jgi:type II secretory pathway pseudopilin PulG
MKSRPRAGWGEAGHTLVEALTVTAVLGAVAALSAPHMARFKSTLDVQSAVTNGASFPVSETEGVPAVAFNEQGIPVSLDAPTQWGSGAGAVYVTDGGSTVYAASISPLGEVSEVRY